MRMILGSQKDHFESLNSYDFSINKKCYQGAFMKKRSLLDDEVLRKPNVFKPKMRSLSVSLVVFFSPTCLWKILL